MQFNLILLIGCRVGRVGKRNTGQQAELAGTLNSAGFYGTAHLGILQGHSPSGRRDVGEVQRGVLPAVLMSVCRQYPLVTSAQMLKRWLTLYVHGINLFLLDNPTPDNPLKFIH